MSVVRGDEERYSEGERLRETEDCKKDKNIYFFIYTKTKTARRCLLINM
jgi:hypothetical protein